MKSTAQLILLKVFILGIPMLSNAGAIVPARAAEPDTQSASMQGGLPRNRITVLYDAFGKTPGLKKDWGFSALIEIDGRRILFDTGNNATIFAHNVGALGVDLRMLDFVVMSHRHGDHMGGLNHLLSVDPNVRIYAPKENFGVFGASFPGTFYRRNDSLPQEMRYFDGSPPDTLYFGTPWPQGKFHWIAETSEVAPGFFLILLKGSWGVDLDVMEISLAIDTPKGIVLIVGCSHPTIEKIVEAAAKLIDKPIHLLIGGLHLLPATDEQTRQIAGALRDTWNVAWIAPDHCTGEPAFEILKNTFGSRYLYAGLGTTISLGSDLHTRAAPPPSNAERDESDPQTYMSDVRFHRKGPFE